MLHEVEDAALLVQTEPQALRSCSALTPPGKAKSLGETLPTLPTLSPHPCTTNPAGPSAYSTDTLPGSPQRGGQIAHGKPRVSSQHVCPQTEGQATRGCRLPAPASAPCSPRTYAHASSTHARVCAPAARDADKTAIEICYIYLQPSLLPAHWHDTEPRALQALVGLCWIRDQGADKPIYAGSSSGGHGVGHKSQKMGFPCLISQQGHRPCGPVPDPGEEMEVG